MIKYVRMVPEAVAPARLHPNDAGLDLTVIRLVKKVGNVEMYGTGLKVSPTYGHYFDLVPRSSIIKTGYILANSVGVIDPSYTGEVLVALLKVDPNAPDLALPARVVQLIQRPLPNFLDYLAVEVQDLEATARGDGGFGSTGSGLVFPDPSKVIYSVTDPRQLNFFDPNGNSNE